MNQPRKLIKLSEQETEDLFTLKGPNIVITKNHLRGGDGYETALSTQPLN